MRMIFEIRDLKYATPATVSRAGILYISTDDGTQWISLIQSWLKKREEPQNIKDAFQVMRRTIGKTFSCLMPSNLKPPPHITAGGTIRISPKF